LYFFSALIFTVDKSIILRKKGDKKGDKEGGERRERDNTDREREYR
jgi:hypothetical protein